MCVQDVTNLKSLDILFSSLSEQLLSICFARPRAETGDVEMMKTPRRHFRRGRHVHAISGVICF